MRLVVYTHQRRRNDLLEEAAQDYRPWRNEFQLVLVNVMHGRLTRELFSKSGFRDDGNECAHYDSVGSRTSFFSDAESSEM